MKQVYSRFAVNQRRMKRSINEKRIGEAEDEPGLKRWIQPRKPTLMKSGHHLVFLVRARMRHVDEVAAGLQRKDETTTKV